MRRASELKSQGTEVEKGSGTGNAKALRHTGAGAGGRGQGRDPEAGWAVHGGIGVAAGSLPLGCCVQDGLETLSKYLSGVESPVF